MLFNVDSTMLHMITWYMVPSITKQIWNWPRRVVNSALFYDNMPVECRLCHRLNLFNDTSVQIRRLEELGNLDQQTRLLINFLIQSHSTTIHKQLKVLLLIEQTRVAICAFPNKKTLKTSRWAATKIHFRNSEKKEFNILLLSITQPIHTFRSPSIQYY